MSDKNTQNSLTLTQSEKINYNLNVTTDLTHMSQMPEGILEEDSSR